MTPDDEARRLIAELGLTPHPEGGWFRETFRSESTITTPRGRSRAALTSIVFLLTGEQFSAFHRLTADEAWHFYRGDPIAIEIITASGRHDRRVLSAAGPWQTVVPGGNYFAAHVEGNAGYALVGCDVAPGFDFSDFFLPSRGVLMAEYPQHAALIARYTRG